MVKVGNIRLKNLTRHPITVITTKGPLTIDNEAVEARIKSIPETIRVIGDIPVVKITRYRITNLPPPEKDTVLIVSGLVAQAVAAQEDRDDVVCLNTGPSALRSEKNGNIVAVKTFQIY